MDGNDKLYLRYKSVSVYKDAAEKIAPLAELIAARDTVRQVSCAAAVFRAVAQSNSSSTGEWIQKLLLSDDNPFSRAAAMGERISERLKAQVQSELNTFKQLSAVKPSDFSAEGTSEFFPQFGFGGFSVTYEGLLRAYAQNGYGIFSGGDSFIYRDGAFTAATESFVRLSDLKGYLEEKYEVVKNMQDFSESHPAFHTLLFGDRGTGKSTTVRAAANEFRGAVKLIDTDGDLSVLPEIVKSIRGLKQKFIIFADGLSLQEFERCQSGIEGFLDCTPQNWLLYCTVDRERGGAQDFTPEELAMFDRFGLVVTYLNPDKESFADILKQILRSRGIKWRDEYGSVAELAARKKGGRSPRAAKQIADLIENTYALKRCGNG